LQNALCWIHSRHGYRRFDRRARRRPAAAQERDLRPRERRLQRRVERRHGELLGRQERDRRRPGDVHDQEGSNKGTVYTFTDECRDIQSGDLIEGGPTVITVNSPTAFEMGGTSYR
jgi:hypothetical protein